MEWWRIVILCLCALPWVLLAIDYVLFKLFASPEDKKMVKDAVEKFERENPTSRPHFASFPLSLWNVQECEKDKY